jgi:hypothetical protein
VENSSNVVVAHTRREPRAILIYPSLIVELLLLLRQLEAELYYRADGKTKCPSSGRRELKSQSFIEALAKEKIFIDSGGRHELRARRIEAGRRFD